MNCPLDGPRFPYVRTGGDVQARHTLLAQYPGIGCPALVVGGSMGAQQTYVWPIRRRDMVERAVPIAGFAKNSE